MAATVCKSPLLLCKIGKHFQTFVPQIDHINTPPSGAPWRDAPRYGHLGRNKTSKGDFFFFFFFFSFLFSFFFFFLRGSRCVSALNRCATF